MAVHDELRRIPIHMAGSGDRSVAAPAEQGEVSGPCHPVMASADRVEHKRVVVFLRLRRMRSRVFNGFEVSCSLL